MAVLAEHRTVGAPFSNEKEVVRIKYNFANDTGAIATYNMFTASGDMVVESFYAKGIVELDSAADGTTIDVGITTTEEDIFLDGVAEATFAAGALIKPTIVEGTPNVIPMPIKLADGGVVAMKIVGEALTSGECEFVFVVSKF